MIQSCVLKKAKFKKTLLKVIVKRGIGQDLLGFCLGTRLDSNEHSVEV